MRKYSSHFDADELQPLQLGTVISLRRDAEKRFRGGMWSRVSAGFPQYTQRDGCLARRGMSPAVAWFSVGSVWPVKQRYIPGFDAGGRPPSVCFTRRIL
jgi:hypothetical protein